jgi:hypothetical protein
MRINDLETHPRMSINFSRDFTVARPRLTLAAVGPMISTVSVSRVLTATSTKAWTVSSAGSQVLVVPQASVASQAWAVNLASSRNSASAANHAMAVR